MNEKSSIILIQVIERHENYFNQSQWKLHHHFEFLIDHKFPLNSIKTDVYEHKKHLRNDVQCEQTVDNYASDES
jgi:hypothetical protein